MAIRDLLWACPLCGGTGTIRARRRAEWCTGCNATFRRGKGALIVATNAGGERIELPAQDWLDRLAAQQTVEPSTTNGPARVRVRFAGRKQPLRTRNELLGWIERFEPPRTGDLVLTSDRLRFRADDGSATDWRLVEITALQPSSTSLQLKARAQPLASIRFLEHSVRFWEARIQTALRVAYAGAGKGEIAEFQPCIVFQ